MEQRHVSAECRDGRFGEAMPNPLQWGRTSSVWNSTAAQDETTVPAVLQCSRTLTRNAPAFAGSYLVAKEHEHWQRRAAIPVNHTGRAGVKLRYLGVGLIRCDVNIAAIPIPVRSRSLMSRK